MQTAEVRSMACTFLDYHARAPAEPFNSAWRRWAWAQTMAPEHAQRVRLAALRMYMAPKRVGGKYGGGATR